jgi:hypothetical protein
VRDGAGKVGASDRAEREAVGCGCCVGKESEKRIAIESVKWNERPNDGESEEVGRD